MIIEREVVSERPVYVTWIHCETIEVRLFERNEDWFSWTGSIDVSHRPVFNLMADLYYFGEPS